MPEDLHALAERLRKGDKSGKLAQLDDETLLRKYQAFRAKQGGAAQAPSAQQPPPAQAAPIVPAKVNAGRPVPPPAAQGPSGPSFWDFPGQTVDVARGVLGGAVRGTGRVLRDMQNTYADPSFKALPGGDINVGAKMMDAADWIGGITPGTPGESMASKVGSFAGEILPAALPAAGVVGAMRGAVPATTAARALLTSGLGQGLWSGARRAIEPAPPAGVEQRSAPVEAAVQTAGGVASDVASTLPWYLRIPAQAGVGALTSEAGGWREGAGTQATIAALTGKSRLVPHDAFLGNAQPLPPPPPVPPGPISMQQFATRRPPSTPVTMAGYANMKARPEATPPALGPIYGPEPQPPIQGPAPRPTPLVTNTGPGMMEAFFPKGPAPLRPSPAPGGRPVSTPGYTPPAPLAGEVNQPPPGPPNLGTIPPIYRAPEPPPLQGPAEQPPLLGPEPQPPLLGPEPQPPLQGPEPQPPLQGPAEGPPYMGPGGGPSSTPPVDLASIAPPPRPPTYIPPTRPLLPPRPVPPPSPLPGQMQGLYDTQNPPPTHDIPPVPLAGYGVGREGPGTLGDVGRMGLGVTGYDAAVAPPLPMGPTTGASLGLRTPWKSAQESQEAIQRAREGTLGRPWRSQADEGDEAAAAREMLSTGEITPLVTNKPKAKRGPRGTRPKMTPTGPPTPEGMVIQELDEGGTPGGEVPVIGGPDLGTRPFDADAEARHQQAREEALQRTLDEAAADKRAAIAAKRAATRASRLVPGRGGIPGEGVKKK